MKNGCSSFGMYGNSSRIPLIRSAQLDLISARLKPIILLGELVFPGVLFLAATLNYLYTPDPVCTTGRNVFSSDCCFNESRSIILYNSLLSINDLEK
jgi:hypothetical protein